MLLRRVLFIACAMVAGCAVLLMGTQPRATDTEAARLEPVLTLFLTDSTGAALDTTYNGSVILYCDQCPDTTGTTVTGTPTSITGEYRFRGVDQSRMYVAHFYSDSGNYVIEDSLWIDLPKLGTGAIWSSANFDTTVIPYHAFTDATLPTGIFNGDSTYTINLSADSSVPDSAVAPTLMRITQFDDYLEVGTYDARFDSLTVAEHCSLNVAEGESLKVDHIAPRDSSVLALQLYANAHAAGDVIYWDADSLRFRRLGVGSNGQVLKLAGGVPTWADGDAWGDAVDAAIIPDTDDTYDIGDATHQFQDAWFDGTLEADVITEGGNAVYNSSETPGGELGGTWASPTVDSGIHDDEYLELDGTGVMTGSVVFEGATANSYETTLAVTDPTADRTVTLPNATGKVPVLVAQGTTTFPGTTTLAWSESEAAVAAGDMVVWNFAGQPPYNSGMETFVFQVGASCSSGQVDFTRVPSGTPINNAGQTIDYWVYRWETP